MPHAYPYENVIPSPSKNQEMIFAMQGGMMSISEGSILRALLGVVGRQGASATVWTTAGTTTQPLTGPVSLQVGSASMVTTDLTVTYPYAFAAAPIVVAILKHATTKGVAIIRASNAASFDVSVYDMAGTGIDTVDVMWMAIGPRAA